MRQGDAMGLTATDSADNRSLRRLENKGVAKFVAGGEESAIVSYRPRRGLGGGVETRVVAVLGADPFAPWAAFRALQRGQAPAAVSDALAVLMPRSKARRLVKAAKSSIARGDGILPQAAPGGGLPASIEVGGLDS